MLLERDLLDDEQIENDVCNVIIDLSKDECSELRTLALTVSINNFVTNLNNKFERLKYKILCNGISFEKTRDFFFKEQLLFLMFRCSSEVLSKH